MSNDNIIIDNLDRKLGKEIYSSLKEIITKYPRLNNTICLVSDIDYLVLCQIVGVTKNLDKEI